MPMRPAIALIYLLTASATLHGWHIDAYIDWCAIVPMATAVAFAQGVSEIAEMEEDGTYWTP